MNDYVADAVSPYLARMKPTGGPNVQAICPFHEDPSSSTPSFSMNMDNGLWQCFGCDKRGNLYQFLTAMNVPRAKIKKIVGPVRQRAKKVELDTKRKWKGRFRRKPFEGERVLPDGILGLYDYAPIKLLEAGFDENILRTIGVGFDKSLRRITFPIRDLYGSLVGISGRARDGVEPRYRVYEGGYKGHDGGWVPGDFGADFDELFPDYHINNRNFCWNAHRAWRYIENAPRNTPLIIVEGFKACMWVEQQGWPNVVALMGTSISGAQIDVVNHIADGHIVLLLDNGYGGMVGRWKVGQALRKSRSLITVASLPEDVDQPDDGSQETLARSIENPRRYERWLTETWRTWCQETGVHVDRPLDAHRVAEVAEVDDFGTGPATTKFLRQGKLAFPS